jgi:hypothetical protein
MVIPTDAATDGSGEATQDCYAACTVPATGNNDAGTVPATGNNDAGVSIRACLDTCDSFDLSMRTAVDGPASEAATFSPAATVGSVLGGLVCLALAVVAVFRYIKRTNTEGTPLSPDYEMNEVVAFDVSNRSTKNKPANRPRAASITNSTYSELPAKRPSSVHYATINEDNYMEYLTSEFGNGNKADLKKELAALDQSTDGVRPRKDTMYLMATQVQRETEAQECYLGQKASKQTPEECKNVMYANVAAMSEHKMKYDELYAQWSNAPWLKELDIRHQTIKGMLKSEPKQPNPDKMKVTSKEYMFWLLKVYNDNAPGKPVPTVVAACDNIVKTLTEKAVTFIPGPIKKEKRIFEKSAIHRLMSVL